MITKNLKLLLDPLDDQDVKFFYKFWLANKKDFDLILKEAKEAEGTITCKGLY
jgi:hypothetical protein